MSSTTNLKMVTIDLETFPNLVYSWDTWGKNWNAIEVHQESYIMCVGIKWYGKPAKVLSIWDYPLYKKDPLNEQMLMEETWKVLDEADLVIGWNSKRFDVKRLQGAMIKYGMKPPSPFKQLDLMVEKKKLSNSNSNKLEETGKEWKIGQKMKHEGWPLWLACHQGDKEAQKRMVRYCAQDIRLTEKAYDHVKSWIDNIPYMGAYVVYNPELPTSALECPFCHQRTLQKRGTRQGGRVILREYIEFWCKGCGRWPRTKFL